MVIFFIDMVDMFLVAYLMGVLCDEVNMRKILTAVAVIVICASGVMDSIRLVNSVLLCQFLLLGIFMRGNFVQRLAWCVELQMLIVILDCLLENFRLIGAQIRGEDFNVYFGSQGEIIARGVIVVILVMVLWKKRPSLKQVFREISMGFSVYIIINMGVGIITLCAVSICLEGTAVEKMMPVFAIGALLLSILQMILCIVVQQLIYSKRELKRLNEMGEDYIEQQKKYYEEIDKKNLELRDFRHDFYEHIYVLADMAERENTDELKSYLSDLSKKRNFVYYINTGNSVANAVVNRYYEIAVQQGIQFVYIGYMAEKLRGITEVEICSVLSNVLKNAVEAVQRVSEDSDRKIVVEMGNEGGCDYMLVENTADGYEEDDGKLKSKKKDRRNHGIGMENVKNIMESCGGKLEWKYTEGKFYTRIYFPICEKVTN